jgi:hypothetical protein
LAWATLAAGAADAPDAPDALDAPAAPAGTGDEAIPPSVRAPSATVAAIDATIDLDLFIAFPLWQPPHRLPDWPVALRRTVDSPPDGGDVADSLCI